jgi:hypothetical protein
MTSLIGTLKGDALSATANSTEGRGFTLGQRHTDAQGFEWIYVLAGAAIPQYAVVTVRSSATATPFASNGVAGGGNAPLAYGIAASASIGSGSYGWVMTRGRAAVKVCASSTGTISGQLYACASANAGLVQTTASGGVKLTTLFAAASTVSVVFGNILTSA